MTSEQAVTRQAAHECLQSELVAMLKEIRDFWDDGDLRYHQFTKGSRLRDLIDKAEATA